MPMMVTAHSLGVLLERGQGLLRATQVAILKGRRQTG